MNIAEQDFLKFPLGLEQATHMASYHLILFIFFFKQNLSSIEGVWFALSISAHTLAAFFLYGLNSADLPQQQCFFDY